MEATQRKGDDINSEERCGKKNKQRSPACEWECDTHKGGGLLSQFPLAGRSKKTEEVLGFSRSIESEQNC